MGTAEMQKIPVRSGAFSGLGAVLLHGVLWAVCLGGVISPAWGEGHNPATFDLESLRWEHRVLVVSAAHAGDPAWRQQLSGIDPSDSAFAERDLLLVTLLDDGRSNAGDRALSEPEVIGVRSALRIDPGAFAVILLGKDGGVKLRRNKPVPVSEIYALIDTMPMRRREMEPQDD